MGSLCKTRKACESPRWFTLAWMVLGVFGPSSRGESPAPPSPAASYFTLTPPAQSAPPQYLQADPADRAPLMSLLDRTAAGRWMEQNRLSVFGYAEGSYTYNTIRPAVHLNAERSFDAVSEDLQLNQFDIAVERKVDPRGRQFDWGFHLEGMFGTDGQQIHSNGLSFHANPPSIPFQEQFDLPQAYVDLYFPLGGRGLNLRLGKFETFFGGSYDPNHSLFYSRNFVFASGSLLHQYTFTGALATYDVNDRLKFDLGFSRGFDQSLKDNNGAIDVLGRVRYQFNDRLSAFLAAVVGPEQRFDNHHYRTVIEGVARWAATDDLGLIVNCTYAHQGGATLNAGELRASDFSSLPPSFDRFRHGKYLIIPLTAFFPGRSNDCNLYDVTGMASYRLNPMFTVNFRAEWFRDEQGYVTFVPGNYYEMTLGTTIKPFVNAGGSWGSLLGPNFLIRPEIRWDKGPRAFDQGTHSQQLTVAVDAIIKF